MDATVVGAKTCGSIRGIGRISNKTVRAWDGRLMKSISMKDTVRKE